MYNIEPTDFGVHLTFAGTMHKAEMEAWLDDSREVVPSLSDDFSVFVDMRELEPLPEPARVVLIKGQRYYQRQGMLRSFVLLDTRRCEQHWRRIAQQSGISEGERYLDANEHPDWEERARRWLLEGVEPTAPLQQDE